MRQNTSIYKLLLYVAITTSLISCKRQLEEVIPQDRISKSLALTDAGAAQTLYAGAYALFRSNVSTFFNLGEMRSDIWVDGIYTESPNAGMLQLYTHNISALNVPFDNWAGFYNLIYNINNVIDVLPKSPVDAAISQREVAEMYGLRAYIYYTMLKTWGGVPITTTPVITINNAAETYKARSTPDSVMLQIKSDIEKSLELFGNANTFPSGNRVFWNRITSLVLKGDVYIWSGTHLEGGKADFTTAKAALAEVEALQGTSLMLNANYADIFDPTKKSNNPEIIFAVNYELGQATQTTFTSFLVNNIQASGLSFAKDTTPKVLSVYPYVSGANGVGMSQATINKLTADTTDQRIPKTFRVMYTAKSPFDTRGILLTKFIGTTSGSTQVYNNDYPVYRYADVLLLMAEAKTKLGEDPASEINQIRKRAHGDAAQLFTNGSVSSNMNAILDEYLREFIGEGKRWWALRRAGDDYVYAAIRPSYLSPTTTAKLLLPISQTMMNNDPLLTQTPGY
ncbi:carbohydrate-binding protein SusD [Niabella ginsenosidivorans]|uniref:Carbohydrate-binding protein SusD n=1 Tax=Niabella ginsenosidivorans TaxID=1176587 RepID=A0A1A9I646_9BACT|nr:RagB/SusD family nutrient uptake outer membrane protein [Niabella ginsenosidivorans]ANH83043.1 carbohydrate-binding protein SusD [Niabella ginsenosidivorans]